MAYIGNGPGVASQRIVTSLTATSNQTTFTPTSGYTVGYVDVYLNGVRLVNGTDYTASNGTTVVLASGAAENDVMEIVAYLPRGLSDGYTKAEADARYEPLDSAYTKAETDALLANIDALPSQSGNAGKFLTTDGTNASWATVTMPDEIRDPVNSSPANGSGGQLETPTLTSSAFRSLYGETHSKSQWQVSTASDFSTTVVSTGDSNSLTSYTIPSGVLSPSTTYYWRVRYKDSNGTYSDWSTATTFITVSAFNYSVEYLIVAGGGGGAELFGGGGAGGVISGSVTAILSTAYSLTVGLGGSGAPATLRTNGSAGSNSTGFGQTAIGGGAGGADAAGTSGGSGGGGGGWAGTAWSGGSGTSGQGYGGGSGTSSYDGAGGAGGGAGAAGGNASFKQAGNGGNGIQWLNGSYYGGGGGATCWQGSPNGAGTNGTGGLGGGGIGGGATNALNGIGQAGAANTGGGGGGGARNTNTPVGGGAGGSGIVIIRYSGSQRGSGGTVTSSGGYTYHTFTSSGTFTA